MPGLSLLFAGNTLLSAGLLFMIQPLVGKALLPAFGGGATVWTAVMLFFQAALLAGSLIFHLTTSRLGPRLASLVHVGLAMLGAAMLPRLPVFRETGAGAAFDVLATLALSYGPAMLAMGANSAALQAWYAAAIGRAPWWLYAISNAGSLAGLLAYPLLVEPTLALSDQGQYWAWGFTLSAAGIAVCAAIAWRAAPGPADRVQTEAPAEPLPWFAWIALAALPSSLMLGATEYITIVIAPLPLLWVLPLAAYLLAWILAFWNPQRALRLGMTLFVPAALLATADMTAPAFGHVHPALAVAVHLAALLGAATMAHARLALLRPAAARLTGFYLAISAGGVLGGFVNAILAPTLFPRALEYPVALGLCWLILAATLPAIRSLAWIAALAAAVLPNFVLVSPDVVAFHRDFYGSVQVLQTEAMRHIAHGRTTHGTQWRDPARAREPTFYYHREAGGGRLIAALEQRRAPGAPPLEGYVVGLGAGTMACYQSPRLRLTFAEISPAVVTAARRWFTFLSACGEPRVEIGDGRLLLLRRPPASLDLLVIDAYSGGHVPVHLATVEAFAGFFGLLRPDGVIAMHVSNERLDVARFVAAAASAQDATVLRYAATPEGQAPSVWLAATRDEALVRDLRAQGWTSQPLAPRPWHDDRWDLLSALRGE